MILPILKLAVPCLLSVAVMPLAMAASKVAAQPAKPEPALVEVYVNGTPISRDHVTLFQRSLVSGDAGASKRPSDDLDRFKAARKELIAQEAMAQLALKEHLDKDPQVAEAVAYVRREALSRRYIEKYFEDNPVTDAVLRGGYEWSRTNGKILEYKVRHILVATRDEAEQILARLKKGEKFEELTKLTKDPGGNTNGGFATPDGWFRPDIFVDIYFSDAVVGLKPGSYTPEPVRTRFGWHLIKVDERPRPVANPEPFEKLPESVVSALRQKTAQRKLNELVDAVVAKAKVTTAQGKPLAKSN